MPCSALVEPVEEMIMRTITLALAFSCLASVSQAVSLAVWNFNDQDLAVDRQLAGVNAQLTTTVEASNVTYFSGTDIGADGSDSPGQALAL